jgi:hypothetical protein
MSAILNYSFKQNFVRALNFIKQRAVVGFFPGLAGFLAFFALISFSSITCGQQVSALQPLSGHVPAAIARLGLKPLHDLPETNSLRLAISLPLRNEAALDNLLQQIYDPASTNYHHYLTPEQFTEQFSPTEQDYSTAAAFFKANGLDVISTYPNRTVLDVSGSAATVEKVFHVALHVYQHPVENRTFFAPDTDPSVNLNVPILHVSGLDNFVIPHPAVKIKNLADHHMPGIKSASGSGPDGAYMGNDFRAAYAPGVTLNGAGQTVGLLELEGYYATDIQTYETNAGLPDVPLTNVIVDSFSGPDSTDTNGITEVSLDIEMVISMATNITKVAVFEEANGGNVVDILNSIAGNSFVKQISCSWLIGDNSSYDPVYKQMAAQGQSFFQASGDDGAYFTSNESQEEYTDDTNITLVGGTTLSTTGPGGAWSSETVWNWYSSGEGAAASGGGTNFNGLPIPVWQQGVNMASNQGSTALRNVPDVALTADNIYVQATNSQFFVGGTSCAAPLWAGFTALMNQQAATYGKPYVGFLNPAVYAIGKSANYTLDFRDITTGNNTNTTVGNRWFAATGYDLCTGWGTPNGQNLINALVQVDPLLILPLPSSGFSASGYSGGPFSPNSQISTLTNISSSSLTWSLVNTSSWLNASATSGTLAADATSTVTFSLTAVVNSLAVGNYSTTATFSNQVSHVTQGLQFNLQVLEPLVITPNSGFATAGFSGGPFNTNSQVYTLSNSSVSSLPWSLINTSSWLSASVTSGTLAGNAASNDTISLSPVANSLGAGNYSATVVFTDQVSHATQNLQFTLIVTEPLVVAPAAGLAASGAAGGPFSPVSQNFALTNIGSVSLNWQASGPSWLTLSPTNGALAGNKSTNVTATLNSNANNLTGGVYAGQVAFTDETSGVVQDGLFTLSIDQNIVLNGGFETGNFTDWTLTEGKEIYSFVDDGSTSGFPPHSGNYFAALGRPNTLGTLSQTLSTISGQSYLLSFWFFSPNAPADSGGQVNTSTPNELTCSWNGSVLFNQSNIPAYNYWSNEVFIVTATGSSTVLKFGERDDPWVLGLDDVSATPIPLPTIQSVSKASKTAITLTVNSLPNLIYEVQYSTNLVSGNWFNLSTNTASGMTLTFTNPIGTNAYLFYRVVRLP